jgi:hypothetical protein
MGRPFPPADGSGFILWWNHKVIPEGHVLATLSIVRRELSLSPGINQAFIQVHNESPTNVSLTSSLPCCTPLSPTLPALRHTSSIRSQYKSSSVRSFLDSEIHRMRYGERRAGESQTGPMCKGELGSKSLRRPFHPDVQFPRSPLLMDSIQVCWSPSCLSFQGQVVKHESTFRHDAVSDIMPRFLGQFFHNRLSYLRSRAMYSVNHLLSHLSVTSNIHTFIYFTPYIKQLITERFNNYQYV